MRVGSKQLRLEVFDHKINIVEGNLDQFYTKNDVAAKCYDNLLESLPELSKNELVDIMFLEPSAGTGSFFKLLPPNQRRGFDLEPKFEGIKQADFLKIDKNKFDRKKTVVVGNPPFGRRSRTAISFFNKAAEVADIIGLILPNQFRKYSVHSRLHPEFKLVNDFSLRPDSFYLESGKTFQANCVFQIWTRNDTSHKNMRLIQAPPTSHPDFQMWQYNNTKQALKVFNFEFNFAVPRQGYEDYSRRETIAGQCERHKQWALFWSHSTKVRDRLWHLNFEKLAQNNTTIPGYGKADVVKEYADLYAR